MHMYICYEWKKHAFFKNMFYVQKNNKWNIYEKK